MPNSRSKDAPGNRVLGIDPGFDRLGVAILEKENNKERVIFSTCIVTDRKADPSERLRAIGEGLREIMRKYSPAELAIEKLFFNQNVTTALKVAEARGVVLYEASSAGLSVHEYSPQDVKIAVTGYGKASKLDVERMVLKLVKLPAVPSGKTKQKRLDDELDAIALGITHFAHRRYNQRLSTD